MNGRYKEKLQKQFLKSTLIPVIIFFGIITLILSAYLNGYAFFNLKQQSDRTHKHMQDIYSYYETYLFDAQQQEIMQDVLTGEISPKRMTQEFRMYCFDAPVRAELLLLNEEGVPTYFSGDPSVLQSHLQYFVRLLFQNQAASADSRNTIYHYAPAVTHKWLLSGLLQNEESALLGQALILLDAQTLSAFFSNSGYETVVTNGSGAVVTSTNFSLLDSRNGFSPNQGRHLNFQGVEYLVDCQEIPQADLLVYTLAAIQHWGDYYTFGFCVLLVVALLLVVQSRKFAHQLAESSALSLEKLHKEFTAVQENPQHKIEINSDDEFGDIAQRINQMLADIQALNEKSLALERSRNEMEIAQIKSYFRPHFIYNTLESIHFSILMNDTEQAGEVLMKLTSLLRYSVDNTVSFFTLEEDVEHLTEYMEIMQFRHGDRFTWSFDIAENTRNCLVPPLFIQPLVENSLKYGFSECERIHISVRAWLEDDALQLSVSDNGKGMTKAQLEYQRCLIRENRMDGGHFGIALIARNVRLQYGEDSSVLLESTPGEGLTVRLTLKRRAKNNGI